MRTGTIIRSAILLGGEEYTVIDFTNVVRVACDRDTNPFVLDLTPQEAADLGAALESAAARHGAAASSAPLSTTARCGLCDWCGPKRSQESESIDDVAAHYQEQHPESRFASWSSEQATR